MTTGERIEQLAKERGLSIHKLAVLAGVSYNTLYSAVKRKSDRVDRKTVEKVAKALGVDITVILSEDQRITDFAEEAMKRYPEMDVIDILIHVRAKRMNDEGRLALLNYAEELSKKPEYQNSGGEPGEEN